MGQGVGSRRKRHLRHAGQAVGVGLEADLEHEGSKQAMKAASVSETALISDHNLCMREVTGMRTAEMLFEASKGSWLGAPSRWYCTQC